MKMIGMIGGMSWRSSAEYYRLVNAGMQAHLGEQNNAKSVMVTVNFSEIEYLQRVGDWNQLATILIQSAQQLRRADADFIVLCTNTMHVVASAIEEAVPLPLLHIVDATAARLKHAGFKRVGLIGTRFTMEMDFYRERLWQAHGIETIVPAPGDRDTVHRVIYDELCHGIVAQESRSALEQVIRRASDDLGAEAVVLGCTEIGLLLRASDSTIPLFDTTAIHAESAVEMALA